MRVGYISSWSECCGVSEYTRNLAYEIKSLGHDIKIAANYPKAKLYEDEFFVKRCFHCPFMTNEVTADIDLMVNFLADCNIIHCGFETSLYHPSWFPEAIKLFRLLGIPVVLTMHSSGMWPTFDTRLVSCFVTHTKMWCSNIVWPIPVKFSEDIEPEDYNSIISFGLGRNRDDLVNDVIKGTNLRFTTTYGHHKWLPLNELVETIQKSWIVSLIYPDIGTTEVSSSAIALAFGCNRPILISGSNWFRNDRNYPGVYVCSGVDDTREIVKFISENPEEIKEEIKSRKEQIIQEGRSNDQFVKNHERLYYKLLNS